MIYPWYTYCIISMYGYSCHSAPAAPAWWSQPSGVRKRQPWRFFEMKSLWNRHVLPSRSPGFQLKVPTPWLCDHKTIWDSIWNHCFEDKVHFSKYFIVSTSKSWHLNKLGTAKRNGLETDVPVGQSTQTDSQSAGELPTSSQDVRLVRLVGQGSYGSVYFSLWSGAAVACKVSWNYRWLIRVGTAPKINSVVATV